MDLDSNFGIVFAGVFQVQRMCRYCTQRSIYSGQRIHCDHIGHPAHDTVLYGGHRRILHHTGSTKTIGVILRKPWSPREQRTEASMLNKLWDSGHQRVRPLLLPVLAIEASGMVQEQRHHWLLGARGVLGYINYSVHIIRIPQNSIGHYLAPILNLYNSPRSSPYRPF